MKNRILFSILLTVFSFVFSVSAKQEKYIKHTVVKGETITIIAQKYKITPYDIYKLNPDSQNGIQLDSVLLIPSSAVGISTNITPKPKITTLPPDNRIDSLHNIVDSLDQRIVKLRHDYDSAQAEVKIKIKYIKEKNAQDISNINNYTLDQRDSLWSTFKP